MKWFGFALAIVAAFGGSAVAADMSLKAPPAAAVNNWTGCYAGLSVGLNLGRTSGYENTSASTLGGGASLPAGFNYTGGFDLHGVLGGVLGGCNYQFSDRWVIGAEADWSFTDVQKQASLVPGGIALNNGLGNVNDVWSLKERSLGTARVRLGYTPTARLLSYVTGGAAWAKVETFETIATNPTPPETAFQTHWRGGWTAGAGLEYLTEMGWSIRAEYIYVDLGRWTTFTNIPNGLQGIDTFTNLSVNLQNHIVRVGLAYNFGWPPY